MLNQEMISAGHTRAMEKPNKDYNVKSNSKNLSLYRICSLQAHILYELLLYRLGPTLKVPHLSDSSFYCFIFFVIY